MTLFHHGDRIRYETTDDDGFPVVRYGFVGGFTGETGPVVVMLDGELAGDVVEVEKIQPVHIGNVTLTLDGTDLLDDPTLRQGLVNLWAAEAETAGLQIGCFHAIGNGVRDSNDGYSLAELSSAGEHYVLRATVCPNNHNAVTVHAERPQPWE